MTTTTDRAPALVHRVGTDLVEVQRIEELFREQTGIEQTLFSEEEISYSNRKFAPYQHFAARFAAKEACVKALGTGMSGEMDWQDVEVRRERSGKPILHLSGETARKANRLGVVHSMVSMSHTAEYAVALVVLVIAK